MENADRTVLLIDLSALYHAAHHVVAENESITKVRDLTLGAVRKCESLVGNNPLVAICCDSRSSWRKRQYPEYKAQREKKPESFYGLFDDTKAALKDEGYLIWQFDGYEADDVIAAAHDAARFAGHDVVIASHDKDLCQLIGTKTKVLRTHDWTWADEAKVVEKFGVPSNRLVDWLALTGDASDNVPGCKGIGPKTATEILKRHPGGIDDMMEYLFQDSKETPIFNGHVATDPFWQSKKAILSNIQQCHDAILLSHKLVMLDASVPLNFKEIYERRDVTRKAPTLIQFDDEQDPFEEIGKLISDAKEIPAPSVGVEPASSKSAQGVQLPAPGVQTETATPGPEAKDLPSDVSGPGANVTSVATTEIARRPVDFNMSLEPSTTGALIKVAQILYESSLYGKFKNPQQIVAVALRGREMGWGVGMSMDAFHVIDGAPSLKAHTIGYLAEQHEDLEWSVCLETTNESCTYEMRRKSWPAGRTLKYTYTIDDAVEAGYCTKDIQPRDTKRSSDGKLPPDKRGQWDKQRRAMIRKTCMVQMYRIAFPGVALGLTSYEEMGGEVND